MELYLQDHGTYEAFVVSSIIFLHQIFILLTVLTSFSSNATPLNLTMLGLQSSLHFRFLHILTKNMAGKYQVGFRFTCTCQYSHQTDGAFFLVIIPVMFPLCGCQIKARSQFRNDGRKSNGLSCMHMNCPQTWLWENQIDCKQKTILSSTV